MYEDVIKKRKLIRQTAEDLSEFGFLSKEEAVKYVKVDGLDRDDMLKLMSALQHPNKGLYETNYKAQKRYLYNFTKNKKISCSQLKKIRALLEYDYDFDQVIIKIVDRIEDPENAEIFMENLSISTRQKTIDILEVYYGEDFLKEEEEEFAEEQNERTPQKDDLRTAKWTAAGFFLFAIGFFTSMFVDLLLFFVGR